MASGAGEETGTGGVESTALGVVIEVPSPLRESLRAWRCTYGGEAAARVEPHITLVSGSTTDWDAAAAHVRAVAALAGPFRVCLQGTGTFRPVAPVVFLNVREGTEACTALHDSLLRGPLGHDLSHAYHPHLTIAHEVADALMDSAQEDLRDESMGFTVSSIGLFGIDEAGQWSLREELELGGAEK
ncbi:2'-5' RNA ligase family protein [Paeniglutamicibacter kerguelensis]|uniref:2'-5' RNA ligase n=1 Tax=Paeniglutamicibacter kerguelensis TaxID=254788 RepID=A0ABS4X9E3_9MICC|nr:2'-5' RNA ligase family protein [Paeniglutamicibacter kerguelensis]MBP2384863.1 2'-5' RNA ligase [Paeniglutamicibacter kerguelensis]